MKANSSPGHRNVFEDIFFEIILIPTVFERYMLSTIFESFSSFSEIKND